MAQIPDHPHRILIIGCSGYSSLSGYSSGDSPLFNLTNQQLDIDEIYLCAKDPYKVKYQFSINKRESTGLKHFNNSKAFIEYSIDIDDIQKKIEESNPN